MKSLKNVETQGKGLISENKLITDRGEEIKCILANLYGWRDRSWVLFEIFKIMLEIEVKGGDIFICFEWL